MWYNSTAVALPLPCRPKAQQPSPAPAPAPSPASVPQKMKMIPFGLSDFGQKIPMTPNANFDFSFNAGG